MKRVITFGTFDLFHYGHLRILERAAELGDLLIVGVSSDELNYRKKGVYPTYCQEHRRLIVEAIRHVDSSFIEDSLELKRHYILQHQADILVMGDDWEGRFDWVSDVCEVRYLPRTADISTQSTKNRIVETHG